MSAAGEPTFVARLSGWQLGAALDADTFRFETPAGATQVALPRPDS
jgi:hypothetical protein